MWKVATKDDLRLMVIECDDVFDYANLCKVLGRIYIDNDGKCLSYDKYVDLSRLETFDLDIETVVETVKQYRRFNQPSQDIKIVAYMLPGTASPLPWLFSLMTEAEMISTKIFNSIEDCAEYLEVDIEQLQT